MHYLVIGYGNTLRSDDGAGQIVANQIASWNLLNVRSLAVHQLTPELAEDIANADIVFFVDAVISAKQNYEKIEIKTFECDQEAIADHNCNYSILGHLENPRSLLYLSQTIYHKSPLAYWVLIPAINFDFGEQITSITQQGITQALRAIKKIIGSNNEQFTQH